MCGFCSRDIPVVIFVQLRKIFENLLPPIPTQPKFPQIPLLSFIHENASKLVVDIVAFYQAVICSVYFAIFRIIDDSFYLCSEIWQNKQLLSLLDKMQHCQPQVSSAKQQCSIIGIKTVSTAFKKMFKTVFIIIQVKIQSVPIFIIIHLATGINI